MLWSRTAPETGGVDETPGKETGVCVGVGIIRVGVKVGGSVGFVVTAGAGVTVAVGTGTGVRVEVGGGGGAWPAGDSMLTPTANTENPGVSAR